MASGDTITLCHVVKHCPSSNTLVPMEQRGGVRMYYVRPYFSSTGSVLSNLAEFGAHQLRSLVAVGKVLKELCVLEFYLVSSS